MTSSGVWTPNLVYKKSDQVFHNGCIYQTTMQHRASADLCPTCPKGQPVWKPMVSYCIPEKTAPVVQVAKAAALKK
jgi:hypothetical protein